MSVCLLSSSLQWFSTSFTGYMAWERFEWLWPEMKRQGTYVGVTGAEKTKLEWRVAIVLEVTVVLKSSPTAASALPIFL